MGDTTLPPLALSQGDPAGIGPDITLRAWLSRKDTGLSPFIYIGDREVLSARASLLDLNVPIEGATWKNAAELFEDALPVFHIPAGGTVKPGKPDSATASGTITAIERAVEATLVGHASAVVTNPIAKSVLYEAGFGFPGHTEFLANLAARAVPNPILAVMMIAGPELRTVPVTIHIPLKDVPDALSERLIYETCRITAHDLEQRVGIARPRLAIAGLNPHAGEDGALGREDADIVAPAIARLKADGIDCVGPLPADTMFHKAARETYDVAICMYHDQALIPAKALGFDDSVNVTLGLPFIRTSPDHGTAFSLAGTGKAKPDSLIAALKMAATMARRGAP